MNSQRRKSIAAISAHIEEIITVMEGEVSSEIETLTGEEQDYYDNMPESFQDSERGEKAMQAAEQLEAARDEVDQALESLRSALQSLEKASS